MKKLLFLLIITMSSYSLFSQIIINDEDMPQEDDTIRLSVSLSVNGVDYEKTGENYTWDFSELTPVYQRVDTFINTIDAPPVYFIKFIPYVVSNLAMPLLEFDYIPGLEFTDTYSFFKSTDEEFRDVGFAFKLSGIPIPVKYDKPDIYYRFPVEYGDMDSCRSEYGIDLLGYAYFGGWKKRVNHVDGWGTLLTPFGSYETIRIKSDITRYDSVYFDSLSFGFSINRNIKEYKWMGKDFGLPLLKISEEGLLINVEYIDSIRHLNPGISHHGKLTEDEITVYPNPSDGSFIVDIETNDFITVNFMVYSTNGIQILSTEEKELVKGSNRINFNYKEKFKSGFYYLIIKSENDVYIRKLIIR